MTNRAITNPLQVEEREKCLSVEANKREIALSSRWPGGGESQPPAGSRYNSGRRESLAFAGRGGGQAFRRPSFSAYRAVRTFLGDVKEKECRKFDQASEKKR
jgi:hypothetical protein